MINSNISRFPLVGRGANLSDSDSDGEMERPSMGNLDSLRQAFTKADSAAGPKLAPYNDVAKKLMVSFSFFNSPFQGRDVSCETSLFNHSLAFK